MGDCVALATKLRTLPISESLPTVGMLDDVTDVSELRRGLVTEEEVEVVVVVVVVDEAARDAGLRRMDFGACWRCCEE